MLLPAEARLFFLAVKPRESGDDEEIVRLISGGIEWRAVALLAERERMIPVVWRRLRDYSVAMPGELASRFGRRTAVIDFRMATASSLLDKLVLRLDTFNVPSLLLKGAALARSIYPSFTHRPMNDLDVLVPPDACPDAWNLLHADGWALEAENDNGGFHSNFHHLRPLLDPMGSGIVLELHRSMMPSPGPFTLDDVTVWSEARRVRVGPKYAFIPSPEHQLLHLCVHLAWAHGLETGITRAVRDVATLLSVCDLEWETFLELAIGARAATCAYWTLALARTLVSAAVPDTVLASLRPRQPLAMTRALERSYIATGILGINPSLFLTHRLWAVGVHPLRSGHRLHRPWDSSTRHRELFPKTRPPVIARIRGHASDASKWLRFARVFSGASTR
jgi:hypothetical protein